MKKTIVVFFLLCALIFALAGCAAPQSNVPADAPDDAVIEIEPNDTETEPEAEPVNNDIFKDSGINKFELSSEDLNDGVWDSIISNTENGSNVSPQLSWEAVEGAQSYVIYMVDMDAMNWVHWMSNNVTETTLPQGWASEEEYVGPYPPAGVKHNYDIYVIALEQPVEKLKGKFDAINMIFKKNLMSLDEVDGASGNILAYGFITGTYENK